MGLDKPWGAKVDERLDELERLVGSSERALTPIDSRLHGTGLSGCVSLLSERVCHVEQNSHPERSIPDAEEIKRLARETIRDREIEVQSQAWDQKAARRKFRGEVRWVLCVVLGIALAGGLVGFVLGSMP